MPVVQLPHVVLLRKSIPLEIVSSVGQVSPRIQIGSDLYILSRSAFLIQIVGVTITTPVDEEQYSEDVVKLTVEELPVLFRLSIANILI
jgi:hypothetical protein